MSPLAHAPTPTSAARSSEVPTVRRPASGCAPRRSAASRASRPRSTVPTNAGTSAPCFCSGAIACGSQGFHGPTSAAHSMPESARNRRSGARRAACAPASERGRKSASPLDMLSVASVSTVPTSSHSRRYSPKVAVSRQRTSTTGSRNCIALSKALTAPIDSARRVRRRKAIALAAAVMRRHLGQQLARTARAPTPASDCARNTSGTRSTARASGRRRRAAARACSPPPRAPGRAC